MGDVESSLALSDHHFRWVVLPCGHGVCHQIVAKDIFDVILAKKLLLAFLDDRLMESLYFLRSEGLILESDHCEIFVSFLLGEGRL